MSKHTTSPVCPETFPSREKLMEDVVFAHDRIKELNIELLDVHQQLVKTQETLIEAQQQLIAKNEVILRMQRGNIDRLKAEMND